MSAASLHCSSDEGEPSGTGGKGGSGGSGGKAIGGTAGKGGTPAGGRPGGGGEAGEPPVVLEGGAGGAGGSGGAGGAGDEAALDLYVGCRDPLKGSIQHYKIAAAGDVTLVDTALATAEVSNTAWNDAQDILYVAHTDTGRISWFKRDTATGALALDGLVVVPGAPLPTDNPATQTLEVDKTGKFLLAANYTANTVQVFKILPSGGVGALVETITHGTNAHHTVLNSTNKFALVPYYGSNTIGVYNFNATTGALTPHATAFLTVIPSPPPASGPRHLALHENTEWLYAITENAGSIVSFDFDNVAGTLAYNETVSALPAAFPVADAKGGSEIEIAPSGKFLYVSNRLDGVKKGIIGAYSIADADGKLTLVEHYDTGGASPRHFSLSPDGKLLVVGNQNSANMSVFKVDTTDGKLTFVKTTDTCAFPFFARMAASSE